MPQGVAQDVLDVLAGGEHRRPAQEHGDGPEAHRHFDGLAAGIGAEVVVHVVPGAAGRQIDGAHCRALLHHVGHQDALAVHEGQVLVAVAGGIVGELQEQGPHGRHTGLVRLVHERVQVGQHPVAEGVCLADVLVVLLVHPGLGDGVVVVGRVEGEPGLEDAALDPAQQQLRFGGVARKAADVAAHVGAAGQAHAHDGGNVELDGAPVGQVVAAPDLGVALDARKAGPVDDVGPLAGVDFGQGLLAQVSHHVGVEDLQLGHGALGALKVALSLAVLDAVHLAVVVPDRLGPQLEEVILQQLLPGGAGGGVGKVEEAALAAPPAAVVVAVATGVLDKDAVALEQRHIGVVFQDAGLEVGDDVDAHFVHPVKEALGVGEAAVVPVEHIAEVILLAAGVAGGQPEVIQQDALFAVLVDDLVDLLVAVLFQLGVVHGGGAVAQRLLGGHGRTAGQQGVAVQHFVHRRAVEQEQVDVAAVGLVIAVAVPVARDLLPHVKDAVVGVVVEQAQGVALLVGQADIERDVLVHGVAGLGVVADGVLGGHPHPAALLVQVAGLFAKAVEVVVLVVDAGVVAQAAQLVLFKGALPQVGVDQPACGVVQQKGQRALAHDQFQGLGAEGQGLFVLLAGDVQRGDAGALVLEQLVHPVGPGGGDQGVGLLFELAVKGDPHPDDVVGHKDQHDVSLVAVDDVAVGGLFQGLEVF